MATSKQSKQNLQITLLSIDVPSLHRSGTNRHLLTTELIWPRTGTAKKSSGLTLPLTKGICVTDFMGLASKLCFKETCEGCFGLSVSLSESITAANIRKFLRYFAGKSVDILSDYVEDAVPVPKLDDIAALPMIYLSKQLLATADPTLLDVGSIDLDAQDFSEEPKEIVVPLYSCRSIVRQSRSKKPQTLLREKEPDGEAVFSVTAY